MNRGTPMRNSEARKKAAVEPEVYTREQMAAAWDEGLNTGLALAERGYASPNPYRARSEARHA